MKKILAIVLCVLMASAVVTACAAPAATQTEAPAEESAVATEEASAVVDDSVDKIKEAGKLVMLTNAAFPPYEYLGSDNKPAGVDVDMAQAVADELGVELEVVDMDFDGIIPALVGGKGDIAAAGLTILPERLESVDFSDTYADASQLIIVNKEDPKVTSVDDLAGKTIGVQLGTTGDIYVTDVEGATVKQYKSGLEAAMDLKNGKLDAVVLDMLPAANIVEVNEDLDLIKTPFTEEQYAIAVAKGSTKLVEVINKVISELDGKVDEWTTLHQAQAVV